MPHSISISILPLLQPIAIPNGETNKWLISHSIVSPSFLHHRSPRCIILSYSSQFPCMLTIMARRIPSAEENLWIHPVITFSFILAWIAACIAIFTTLCTSCHRKSPPPESPSSPPSNGSVGKTETSPPVAASIQLEQQQQEEENWSSSFSKEEKITELGAPIHGPIYPTSVPYSASKRKLSISLSMGLPEGLNKIKTLKKERQGKGEESLWKKTIILGEKCRLPDEEGRGEEEDNKTSRANSPRSLPPTRTVSLATPDVVVPS